MEFTVIIIAGMAFALLGGALDQRKKAAAERTRLLEEAIRNNSGRDVVEALTWHVTGKKPEAPRPAAKSGVGMAILLAIGWLTLFSGIGVLVLGAMLEEEGAIGAGVLVSIIGFGLVTYPFALRELEARREPQ